MTREAYIIIDIGTGNVRSAVVTPNGELLSVERANVQYLKDELYPESIFFDPDQLWDQIVGLTEAALATTPGIRITAITTTSQREGIVLVGNNGESLIGLPNIDHRGREWEHMIENKTRVYQLTGRYPTSLFSALKLVGIRERRLELWNKTAYFLSISDWAQFKLSGLARYEHSQASETLLYDVEAKQWSPELCMVFDLDPALLPSPGNSGAVLGPLLPEYRSRFRASADALVVIGGSDTQLAVKSTSPSVDDVVIVSGTTTPILKLADRYITDEHQRTWTSRHTDQQSFILEANAGVTGLNYQRLKDIFYPKESYESIETELAELKDFQCVASLGSLIANEDFPVTRGGFMFNAPVSHQLTRASFVWATLWDIACSIKENYHSLCEVMPHEKDYVLAAGGGVESRTLRQFIASLINKKMVIHTSYKQSSVMGGVLICNEALGKPAAPPRVLDVVYPENEEHYNSLYEEWKSTRETFKQLCQERVL